MPNLFRCQNSAFLLICQAILKLERQFIYWPNENERQALAMELAHDFSNCIGFVDGTHVNLEEAPSVQHPEEYFSRKQKYGLRLQVICDFNHMIRHVKLGHTASAHDARVFASCNLAKNTENSQQRAMVSRGCSL